MPNREPFTSETPNLLLRLPDVPFDEIVRNLTAGDLVLLLFALPPDRVLPNLGSKIGLFEVQFRQTSIVVKIGMRGKKHEATFWKFDQSPPYANAGLIRARYSLRLGGQLIQARQYTLCEYVIFHEEPLNCAVSFVNFLRNAFRKKLHRIHNISYNPEVPRAMITLPVAMDCDTIDSRVTFITNGEFNALCQRFKNCQRINIELHYTREVIRLELPINAVLHITLDGCWWFGRLQLLDLSWEHTKCIPQSFTATDFNAFLENWMQGRLPKVKSLHIRLNRGDQRLFVGFTNIRGRFPEDHLYKCIRGFVHEQRYWPLISIRRDDGVFASVYREKGGVQFVEWEAIPI